MKKTVNGGKIGPLKELAVHHREVETERCYAAVVKSEVCFCTESYMIRQQQSLTEATIKYRRQSNVL